MAALPIKGLQQRFKAELEKFEQQIMVAVERLKTALNYSVYKTKSQESDRKKFKRLSRALKKCPEIDRLTTTIKKPMQEQKKFLLKFNGAAITFIGLNIDHNNSVIKELLDINEHGDMAANVRPCKRQRGKSVLKSE